MGGLCELLDGSASVIPQRSVLYRLAPCGLGTAFRESLNSYVLRLADAHCVRPQHLIRDIIAPHAGAIAGSIKAEWARAPSRRYLSGAGRLPEVWVETLSRLTGVAELSSLTLLPLRWALIHAALLVDAERWCPMCLLEMREQGRIYGQLLWEIAAVQACPRHGVMLSSSCRCKVDDRPLLRRGCAKHLPGICRDCGRALAARACVPASQDAVNKARIVAEFLQLETIRGCTKQSALVAFRRCLLRLTREMAAGQPMKLARMLGLPKATMQGWLKSPQLPTLPRLVDVAHSTGTSVKDLLITGELPHQWRAPTSPAQVTTRSRRANKVCWTAVERQLREFNTVAVPIAAAEAGRRLGVSVRWLAKNLPELTRKMSARYIEYRARGFEALVGQRVEQYRPYAEEMHAAGHTVLPRKLFRWIRDRAPKLGIPDRRACVVLYAEYKRRNAESP